MPWVAEKDTKACPVSKPWAVKRQDKPGGPGTTVVPGGCHASKGQAHAHMSALYANVPDVKAMAEGERTGLDVRSLLG